MLAALHVLLILTALFIALQSHMLSKPIISIQTHLRPEKDTMHLVLADLHLATFCPMGFNGRDLLSDELFKGEDFLSSIPLAIVLLRLGNAFSCRATA